MSPRGRSYHDEDEMPAPESVYRELRDHDDRIEGVESKIESLGRDLREEMRKGFDAVELRSGSETRKLIAAIAGSAITVLGGVLGASRLERHDPPPVIPRSALDVRADACRPMPLGPSRDECFARIAADEAKR